MFPLAKTGLLELVVDSPNQRGNRETLIGKIEAKPRPASTAPGISSCIPRATKIAKPPARASARPILAMAVSLWNLRASGASTRPASRAPQKNEVGMAQKGSWLLPIRLQDAVTPPPTQDSVPTYTTNKT